MPPNGPKGTSNFRVTHQIYTELVAAFRIHDSVWAVAQQTQVNQRTVKRAWEDGWPKRKMKPIREVLAAEKAEARARIAREGKERAKLAAEQAIDARKAEGQLVDLARAGSLSALGSTGRLVLAARELAVQTEREIRRLAKIPPGKKGRLEPAVALHLIGRVVALQRQTVETAKQAMEMERLHLGEPTQVVEIVDRSDMTLDEAERRVEAAAKALEGAKRAGGLTVIDGGAAEPIIGQKVDVG